MLQRRLIASLSLCVLLFTQPMYAATAAQQSTEGRSITSICYESTPAWGAIDEIETHQIILIPETGRVTVARYNTESKLYVDSQDFQTEPERISAWVDEHLPGLLTPPGPQDGIVLDGSYMYLTIHYEGSYSMRFGGHEAASVGPEGFRDAANALLEIAAVARDAQAE